MRADGLTKATKRSLTLRLGALCVETLAGEDGQGSERVPARLVRAVRFYLADKGSNQPGWAYPGFLSDKEVEGVDLELTVEENLLRALKQEAYRQGVSVSQLAEHAVLYYAAEQDAGRITQRILDDLGGGDA